MSFSTPSELAGTLARWDPRTEKAIDSVDIKVDQEFYIGRDCRRCQYVIDDPFISNKHLQIYTIIFDRDNLGEVAPLVYAQDLSMNGTTWNGYEMGKGSGSFLLSHGDILKLTPGIYLRFQHQNDLEENGFDMLQTVEMKAFQEEYVITQCKLGSGAYGKVHMAYEKESGRQLACKIVDLRTLRDRAAEEVEEEKSKYFRNKWQESMAKSGHNRKPGVFSVQGVDDCISRKIQDKLDVYHREARVLESISHPNIIRMEKVINSSNTIYLFQDLVTAGDLFSYIQYKGGRLGNIESAVIVRQVLMALNYLHDRDIVHRDLKPDNILMTSLADGGRVVITDFGCARLVKPNVERMSTMIGTYEYSAPEVLGSTRGGYTKAVDLWSLGCVTAMLLTGESPFHDLTSGQSTRLPRDSDFERLENDMEWHNVGTRARDFVRQLLRLDEAERMDVKQALNHPWFTNRAHKREFEALYRRSVRDWKPRVHQGSLIVELSSLIATHNKPNHGSAANSPKDKARGSSSQLSGDSECLSVRERAASLTLSDPELPTHNKAAGKCIDQTSLLYEITKRPLSISEENAFQFLVGDREMPIRNRTPDVWDIIEDEVYEEVGNAVTGKHQQFIYGSNVLAGY